MLTAKLNSRVMENELRLWWYISQRGWTIRRRNPSSPELLLIIEEARAIVMYTDWPLLKAKIQARLDKFDAQGVRKALVAITATCWMLIELPDWGVLCGLLA